MRMTESRKVIFTEHNFFMASQWFIFKRSFCEEDV